MKLRGYLIEVEFDGETLVAEGTNKASQIALRGQDHKQGAVRLGTREIKSVEFKQANPLVNGRVVVFATDGARYQLTFRRKDREAFKGLYDALNAARA